MVVAKYFVCIQLNSNPKIKVEYYQFKKNNEGLRGITNPYQKKEG
jgi:hypothetical protein